MNGYPSRDKRKCMLWLCSVRNWWPSSPVCIQSESLDKTMWASLASLWSWFSALMRCNPSHAACSAASCWACQHLPWTWPGCVWHIPALLNTAGKYWGHRLSVLAAGKSWIYGYHIQLLRFVLVRVILKKKPCHFSVIFFGSIKRTEFPYLWLYRAFPVQHKQDYYRQRKDKRQ